MSDTALQETIDEESRRRQSGQFLFALIFVGLSALLLALIPLQTVWVSKTDWYSQPRFWPAVSLGGMVIFGFLHIRHIRHRTLSNSDRVEGRIWLRPFEYALYFMIYVTSVPIVGFLLATVAFTIALLYRLNYRSPRMLWTGGLFAVAVVVIFKGLLSVRIPGAAIYEYLPAGLRNFFILYL